MDAVREFAELLPVFLNGCDISFLHYMDLIFLSDDGWRVDYIFIRLKLLTEDGNIRIASKIWLLGFSYCSVCIFVVIIFSLMSGKLNKEEQVQVVIRLKPVPKELINTRSVYVSD